jgi:predicted RNA-binding protein with RPS1 domain
MKERQPRLSEEAIEHGKLYHVTVVAIVETGAIVDVEGTGCTAFIHISKVAPGYVHSVDDYISVGDKLDAMGDCKGYRNELVLTHLNLKYKNPREDSKPKFEKKDYKPQPVPEQFTPSQHTPKSLDDMIAAADKSYKDKVTSKDRDSRHQRKHYKNKNKYTRNDF